MAIQKRPDVQPKGRTGARSEPRGGWPLGVKTSVPPESGPVEELAPDEAARQEAADALEAGRRSDHMARRDVSDLGLDEHHVQEGKSAFRTRGRGNEPRTPFGGDPAEERRIADRALRGESPSVWAQDTRAPHYRESWDEQQAEWLQNEGEAAERELRKAVRGGLSELVRVRTVVLADRLTPSAAELERLERRPRLDDDGRRANRRDRAQVVADGLPLAPPLGRSLVHAEVDPALVALAAAEYPGQVLEPRPKPEWLAGPGHAETAAEAPGEIARALDDVENAHLERWRDDPVRAADLERRWQRERDALSDGASACVAPEETRLLLEGMREYAAGLAETGRGVCYAARLHTAVGRDVESSPLPSGVIDAALDRYPDLVEGVRAVDPDSPLLVVPSGMDRADYGSVLGAALDTARGPVAAAAREGAPLDPGIVRARVLADVAGGLGARERDRGPVPEQRSGESLGDVLAEVRERREREFAERVAQRFRDVSDVLASRGVYLTVGDDSGSVERMPSGVAVEVSADAFEMVAERGRDGEWFEGPVPKGPIGVQRGGVADAMQGAAEALWREASDVPVAASERFGVRMTARVFDEVLPLPSRDPGPAEEAAASLATDIGLEAVNLARERDRRIAARDAAVERFEKVFDAVADRVTVTERNLLDDPDGPIGFTVRRDPESRAVLAEVLVDPRLRAGDRSLTNLELAERHGQAYVDLGRAMGAADPDRAGDWSKVYGALASTAQDGRAVTVNVGSCAADRRQQSALGEAKAYAEALPE